MLKKKSTIFALVGVLMFVVALYFMYRETKETYDVGDFEQPEPDEPEPVKPETTVSNEESAEK